MNIKIATLGLAALLASGCAGMPLGLGQADIGIAEWDMDGNGLVGNDEFRVGFDNEDWFDGVDGDNNDMLSSAEFGSATSDWGLNDDAFVNWDADRDGMLSSTEFGDGVFDEWDRSDDELLDENEFGMGLNWFD